MIDWTELTWNESSVGAAVAAVARASGFDASYPAESASLESADGSAMALDEWIDAVAAVRGIEAERVHCRHEELARTLSSLGPSIVRVPIASTHRWLAVVGVKRGALRLVTPARRRARLPVRALYDALTQTMTSEPDGRVRKWIAAAKVPARRAERARAKLLQSLLAEHRVEGIWLVRPDPGSSFVRQLRARGAVDRMLRFTLASIASVAAGVGGWAMIGRCVLRGSVEPGWLSGWILLSLTAIPLQLWTSSAGARLSVDVSALFKQRLLCGALRMDPNEIRARGSGGLLAMVTESEAIEVGGLGGGLRSVVGLVQLGAAAIVLFFGPGGGPHVALLAAWCGMVGWLGFRSARARAAWTEQRFALTNAFVENVVGNRTRVAQQRAARLHVDEDALLEKYLDASHAMDGWQDAQSAIADRGWLAVGLLGILPSMLAGQAELGAILLAIAGVLQAQIALAALVPSGRAILGAAVAFRSIGTLYRAAALRDRAGVPEAIVAATQRRKSNALVLEGRDVWFKYRPEGEPALRGCDFELREGDRVLLEGASGDGKSTLAAVLSGLHPPSSGLVLLRGLDRATLGGATWRKRVANAPQFHENHILAGTLAFNLLMGRTWPAAEDDKREAEDLCRRLGLGSLLDRMPSGLDQVIGETGWQLSHGERSRVFLARALLQRADVVILDESFGALDPETLRVCVDVVTERARTLLVIAHP